MENVQPKVFANTNYITVKSEVTLTICTHHIAQATIPIKFEAVAAIGKTDQSAQR